MQPIKATLLVASLTLLLAVASGSRCAASKYYTCTEYIEDQTTKYKDSFTDLINSTMSVDDLRRVANESVRNISLSLCDWQDQVELDLLKYVVVIDEQVQRFEDAYEARYYDCADYNELLAYIYQRREDVTEPLDSVFARKTKQRLKESQNKQSFEEIDRIIAQCRKNNDDDEQYNECLRNPENVKRAKDKLLFERMIFCKFCKSEVEKISKADETVEQVIEALDMVDKDIKGKKRCEDY